LQSARPPANHLRTARPFPLCIEHFVRHLSRISVGLLDAKESP
jgi:hypothetical protein